MRYLLLATIILTSFSVKSRTLDTLLISVLDNNKMLQSQERLLESEQKKSRTGVYLSNPQVSFNYLWGSPTEIGNQQELEVTQSFQSPGYYSNKSKLQTLQFNKQQFQHEKNRAVILLEARQAFFKLVYLKKKYEQLKIRNTDAKRLLKISEDRYKSGEGDRLGYDKSRIYEISTRNALKECESEIEITNQKLTQLNGGIKVEISSENYPDVYALPPLNEYLNQLSERNPDLLMAAIQKDAGMKKINFEKSGSYPTFEVGYKSEKILDLKLRGVHVGMSIPLWENKNRVKHAKLEQLYNSASFEQVTLDIENDFKSVYTKTNTLLNNLLEIKEVISGSRTQDILLEKLEAGQLSFPEYYIELQFMNETIDNYLKLELDYFNSLAEMDSFFMV